jgi:endonuclease III
MSTVHPLAGSEVTAGGSTMTTKARIGPRDLGLHLDHANDDELFKWLVACALFGARISQDIAARGFRELDRAGLLTPGKLADAGWQRLVDLLDAGGYVRYDESTARELIELGTQVRDRYAGRLSGVYDGARSKAELSRRLQEFKGIGPTAAEIFLREADRR